jgi:hypothetical protein
MRVDSGRLKLATGGVKRRTSWYARAKVGKKRRRICFGLSQGFVVSMEKQAFSVLLASKERPW